MSPRLALVAFSLLILWLFRQDRRRRSVSSWALWLVVVWVAILASRPVSAWFGLEAASGAPEGELSGNSIDRNVVLFLITVGLFVLMKRRVVWHALIANNRWLFLFYLFFGLSVFWSDYPFVTFKRWYKDLGNVVMVLVVLTERDPIQAAQAVMVRCAYLLIPLSVLLIRYCGELGREYSEWTGESYYRGAAMGKNQLGASVLVCLLFLVRELILTLKGKSGAARRNDLLSLLVLLAMGIWLLDVARSATSIVCATVGSLGLVALSMEFVRQRAKHLVAYSLTGGLLAILLATAFDLKSGATQMLGRDPTLHGREEIWRAALAEQQNPVIGSGFHSFWLGTRPERIMERLQHYYLINQAHNGYLEMYLNGGVIGACLFLAILMAVGKKISHQFLVDPDWAALGLVCWLVVMIHNWSEATFCRESPLWFGTVVGRGGLSSSAEGFAGKRPLQ